MVAVEVLGPPGAGKTALSAAVCASARGIRPLSIYLSPRRIPQHLADGLALLPMSVGQAREAPLGARELRCLLRLEGAPRTVERASRNGVPAVIMDQGPVYTMVRLLAGIPEHARSPNVQTWWERTVRFWAGSMDLLILLNAPDDVLLDRVRARSKDHELKSTAVDAGEALAEHRELQETVIAELRLERDIPMLRFDTDRWPVAAIAAEVRAVIGGSRTRVAAT